MLIKKTETLVIYMKSGNQIKVPNVIDWNVKRINGKISEIMIEQKANTVPHLIMLSLDLDNIDAIVKTK